MIPVPGAEDDGFWYEEELDELVCHLGYVNLNVHWDDWAVFPSGREAYIAAKLGDRTAQRLLKETYERYIVAKLTR